MGACAVLIVAAVVVGRRVIGPDAAVGAVPLFGRWSWRLSPAIVPALTIALVVLAWGDGVTRKWSWPALLGGTAAAASAWTYALAAADGLAAVPAPLATRLDYLAAVPRIHSPGAFLRTFVDQLVTYPIHVRAHPPGLPLMLWASDRIGLGGPEWAAAYVFASVGVLAAAVLISCRAVAGEPAARSLAPFLVLMPAAVWLGTSADAIFAAVVAVGIACVAIRRALAGGVVLGGALLLTYGAVPLLIVPAALIVWRRAWRDAVLVALGLIAVLVAARAGGFWWFDGLAATRHEYARGVAAHRSYAYFVLLGNPAALALAIGPAVSGLATLRDRRLWVMAGAALAALAVADVSGLAKAEVERIWLPFVPWLLFGAVSLRPRRWWLASSAATAVVLQLALRSPW